MNIVFGKFLSYDKLESLLSANGITIESLVSGAKDRLERLVEETLEQRQELDKLLNAAANVKNNVNAMDAERKNIQDALKALENNLE